MNTDGLFTPIYKLSTSQSDGQSCPQFAFHVVPCKRNVACTFLSRAELCEANFLS